jgi:ribbon-helix-helix CopG family protein
MRTTLTIDDDVAAQLERLRRSRDVSLKELINDALRRGLQELSTKPKPKKPFRTKAVDVGEVYLDNVDNVAEVLAILEGEAHK